MNCHRWHTRQDVLNDLAEVTGIAVNDFDDDFILRGEKAPPPPRHLSDEDAEIQLRFGCLAEQGDHENVAPDLAGITQMLRMVNNYDETPEIENIETKEVAKEDLSKQTITISKLDPNVKEFVPKSNKSREVCKMKVDTNVLNNLKKEIVKACADKVVKTKTNDIQDNESTGDKNNDEEKLRMAEILKSKIIQGSKAKTLKHKTERNVAIAALMKLNSTPSDTPKVASVVNSPKKIPKAELSNESSGSSPQPILFPPEYFEVPTCSTKVNIEIPEPEVNPEPVMDPQIKESIDKVNNWLNKPEMTKPKAPTIYLEPVTFKKKEASSSSSPSSFQMNHPISSSSPKSFVKVQPLSATPSFVPSSYASDLAKKYNEQSKAKEARDLNIWTKLEKDLKAKDELIKKNKEQQSIDENENDTSHSTRTTFE